MYPECRHIMTSGKKCRSAALTGRAYCYFHFRLHQQRHRVVDHYKDFVSYKFDVPVLEDRASIQLAISEVVQAMARNYMDHKRGGKILYGLQLALQSAKVPADIVSSEPVRELYRNAEGEEIGPKATFYEEGEQKATHEAGEQRNPNETATTDDGDAGEEKWQERDMGDNLVCEEQEPSEADLAAYDKEFGVNRASLPQLVLSQSKDPSSRDVPPLFTTNAADPQLLPKSSKELRSWEVSPFDINAGAPPVLSQSKDSCDWGVGFDRGQPVELKATAEAQGARLYRFGPDNLAQTIRELARDLIRQNPQLLDRVRTRDRP